MLAGRELVGTHDILMITLDTLRYDIACEALEAGRTTHLAAVLPKGQWEERHTPSSFTYAAHHAFFAGFLPTPAAPGVHPRLFAARFAGSETTTEATYVFDAPDIVSGLFAQGYHTVCIGGVGFFNKQTALGSTLPGLFAESHWSRELGVTEPQSTENQVRLAMHIIDRTPSDQRLFLFINISAIHQPNHFYLPVYLPDTDKNTEKESEKETNKDTKDTLASHAAALAYVDAQLPPLFAAFARRSPTLVILCADHGTAYGEEGYTGHRIGHPVVWTVPYAEFILPKANGK